MKRAVRVVDVARQAGVAAGTVSNVLTGKSTVTEENRQKVVDAMRHLGYVPNDAARSLRKGRSRTVGVVVQDVRNPYFADFASGVDAGVSSSEWVAMICDSGGSHTREAEFIAALEQARTAGVVLAPVAHDAELASMTRELSERGTPLVVLGRPSPGAPYCSVFSDDERGAQMVAEHLIDRGHTKVSYVTGPLTIDACRSRLTGLVQGSKGGLGIDICEQEALTIEAGVRAGEELLARSVRPRAIFCANDLLALGVLQAAAGASVPIPHELAVVGFDDIAFASGAAIPLTSVRQPRFEMGKAAGELLVRESEQGDRHEHVVKEFTPELIIRASS